MCAIAMETQRVETFNISFTRFHETPHIYINMTPTEVIYTHLMSSWNK